LSSTITPSIFSRFTASSVSPFSEISGFSVRFFHLRDVVINIDLVLLM